MAVLTSAPTVSVAPRPLDPVRITGVVLALLAVAGSAVAAASASDPIALTSVAPWQLGLALVALAAGIPHGAVDHLVIRRPGSIRGWLAFGALYLAAAAAAAALIIAMPRAGFIVVVLMTIAHFGSGDAAYAASLPGAPRLSSSRRALRIVAGGSVPIVLPLTGSGATATLAALKPELVDWLSPTTAGVVRVITAGLAVLTIVMLLDAADVEGAVEMLALLALALLTPPLVAFAVYFAGWHALRHTARLAQLRDDDGEPMDASTRRLARVALAGMPALIGTAVITVLLWPRVSVGAGLGDLLWVALAVVWGLTVPHMTLVARLDRRAFRR